MSSRKIDITPDKSLIKKLGLVGYRTEQAVAELIDNSIDARLGGTERIDVCLDFKLGRITVSDNGSGMDLDGLRNALTIARETKGDGKLGQFGLGLKSACSSLGKAFTLVTVTPDSQSVFTARYDEDRWLQDQSKDWTNFEIDESGREDDRHGTEITISKVKVPLYPNQLLNFRRRFGVRYGPYLESGQIRIRINSRDCQPSLPDLVEGSKRPVDVTTPSGDRLVGWVGLLAHRSIKGDYGIHLYRNKRLISAFDKFGIRYHPDAARVVGEMSLDRVPVNFHKTGFLVESPEYRDASQHFMENPTVKEILRKASSSVGGVPNIQSVLELDQNRTHAPLDARMSSERARRLLREADRFVQEKDGTVFSFEFDDSSACRIERTDGGLQIGIGRNSRAFRLFKNPLFFIALIRIESELIAEDQSHRDFVERRNRMLDRFIADRLPQQQGQGRPKREAIPLSRYALQSELIELHDHLKESFEHNFQFTGLSTLAPFLQNAYGRLVYSIHTINGAGQSLLESISDHSKELVARNHTPARGWHSAPESISDHSKELVVLLNPKAREFEALFEATKSSRFIAVREYEENPVPAWARPEKAWLDLYFEVTRGLLPLYNDELILILDELLSIGLVTPTRLRSLARRRKIQGEINGYLPRE